MVDFAAGGVRCTWIADADRGGPKVDSASGTAAFGAWRSCAARRVQLTVPATESTISLDGPLGARRAGSIERAMATDHATVAEEEYVQTLFWLQEAKLP